MAFKFDEIDIEDQYTVSTSKQVSIDVTVGNGDIGGIAVMLDGQKLGTANDYLYMILGTGSAVKGKELVIASTVHDVNPQTDRTIVQYILTGGAKEKTLTSVFEATKPSGLVIHVATITFA